MPVPSLNCFCQTSQSALKIISLNVSSPDPVGLFYLKEYSLMCRLIGTGGSRVMALIRHLALCAPQGLLAKDTFDKTP